MSPKHSTQSRAITERGRKSAVISLCQRAVDRGLQVVHDELADDHRQRDAGQRAPEEAGQVAHAGVAPPLVVHAEEHEHGELHEHDRHDDLEELVAVDAGDVEVEAQGVGAERERSTTSAASMTICQMRWRLTKRRSLMGSPGLGDPGDEPADGAPRRGRRHPS